MTNKKFYKAIITTKAEVNFQQYDICKPENEKKN